MGTLIWISKDSLRYGKLFEEGKAPNMRSRLDRIGWGDEYDRTYSYLSSFVHSAVENIEAYRNYELGEEIVFTEIVPDSENYIIQTNEGFFVPLSVKAMSPEKIFQLYGPYLAAKVFDIVISGLQNLYGEISIDMPWCPSQNAISLYGQICSENNLVEKMLWNPQRRMF